MDLPPPAGAGRSGAAEPSDLVHTPGLSTQAHPRGSVGGTPASHSSPIRISPPRVAPEESLESAAPLAKPTLRVQGHDIILEDASQPPPPAAAVAAAAPPSALQQQLAQLAAAEHTGMPGSAAASAQATGPSVRDQLKSSQSREAELKLVSRTTTLTQQRNGGGGAAAAAAAVGGSRQHQSQRDVATAPAALDSQTNQRSRGGTGAPESAAASSSEGPARLKYRSTLTEDNVTYWNKLEQYSAKPDLSERMWRWLEDAGPPFDVTPSLGVPTGGSKNSMAGGVPSRQQSRKKGFFSCFSPCFS